MVVPTNSPTKKKNSSWTGCFCTIFFHSTAKLLDNVDYGPNSICLVVFPGWKLFGFTTRIVRWIVSRTNMNTSCRWCKPIVPWSGTQEIWCLFEVVLKEKASDGQKITTRRLTCSQWFFAESLWAETVYVYCSSECHARICAMTMPSNADSLLISI